MNSNKVRFTITDDHENDELGDESPKRPSTGSQDRSEVDTKDLRKEMDNIDLGNHRLTAPGARDFEVYSIPASRAPSINGDVDSGQDQSEVEQPTPATHGSPLSRTTSHEPHPSYVNLRALGDHSPESTSGTGTPSGDPNDPYRRTKRAPQSKNLSDIAPQFIFKKLDPHSHSHSHSSSTNSLFGAHDRNASTTSMRSLKEAKTETTDTLSIKKSKGHSSSLDLRRFFKHHKHNDKAEKESPKIREKSSPTTSKMPLSDDHANLSGKYGQFGRVLGTGAGGSVRIMKRALDGKIFAVKQFRNRGPNESQREYSKKITAEFCIGSALHHPNVIETLDIINEGGTFYEVMEYAPYDMFAIVMTGKMSREEIYCCFKQVLSGVAYLHNMGLAHRDLKLDNVVVDMHGIIKIIDYGSAAVFRYPFEKDVVLATGIVGSDPYLAPEVFQNPQYDPSAADIWSCAMIFCCMFLRRFPWKLPKQSDASFRLFSMPDNSAEREEQAKRDAQSDQERHESGSHQQIQITGPWRLLRLLPRESRVPIDSMLQLEPSSRATIERVLKSQWMSCTEMCWVDKFGEVDNASNHSHILVGAEGPNPPGT